MLPERLSYLLERLETQSGSKEEYQELREMLNADMSQEVFERLQLAYPFSSQSVPDQSFKSPHWEEILQQILSADKPEKSNTFSKPAHRIHFLRRGWFKYAAAIIVVFGIGAYLWTTNKKTDQKVANNNAPIQKDILPGGDKAVLTLADGSKIVLDNAANGNLAQQGNAAIVKLANGQIAYNLKGFAESDVMMNTMETPKGGQYQLTLPDGSKVWLNAASSIQFPAAFIGSERKVKITGEVYFEVAKNRQKPFIVDVDGKIDVQVLGTSFNINSYTNEEDIKATLVEGKVKITGKAKSVVLVPGQQARVVDQQLQIVNANIDQTLAWKNGIFNFHNADLRTVMKQLERWYDINVEYRNPNTNFTFKGEMYRNLNLSEVLEMLSRNGIRFQMEEKTLIVL